MVGESPDRPIHSPPARAPKVRLDQVDASTLDSMQKLNAELGDLKYTEFLSADRLFNLTHRDRAVKELGRR